MPIIELQRRLAEIGRIRLGRVVESRRGKKIPAALDTFRLTSRDRARITDAAGLYGGTVTKWDESPSGIPQWEVITQADKLPVVVPPSAMAFSQNYELWSAGGCQRRCDGVTERISEQPCVCDPENRACEIHTRLSVMLRDLPGLGVWRVDTQGYYAAVELQGAVEVINLAAGQGQMLPATLRLDQRSIKRPDEGTKNFVVPVLDIEVSPAQLLMGTVAAPKQAALTPVPASQERPASIADQVRRADSQPSRRRATPIPATGIGHRAPAGATVIADEPPDVSGDPYAIPPNRIVDEMAAQAAGPRPISEAPDYDPTPVVGGEAEQTQDQPRMCTKGQLTKLGILLTKRGFDRSAEGKAARMDFCREALKLLVTQGKMKQQPWTGRKLSSSTELTFDEAGGLIELLESEENPPVSENGHPAEPESAPAQEDPDQMSLLPGQQADPV